MSAPLRALAQRACTVFYTMPNPAEQVRLLAASSSSLSTLASTPGRDRADDTLTAAAASATAGQLLSALTALPASEGVAPNVMLAIFRVVRGSTGKVADETLARLLRQLDERMSPACLTMWGPHRQVQMLHTIAKVDIIGPVPLTMQEDLLLCLQHELGKLTVAETAVLLWSLATLRLFSHPLWSASCHRCAALLPLMNDVSRATALQAVLMADVHVGPAQQRLMRGLTAGPEEPALAGVDTARRRRPPRGHRRTPATGEGAGAPLASSDVAAATVTSELPQWASDTENETGQTAEDAVRERLLRRGRELPTDMVLALLRRTVADAAQSGGDLPGSGLALLRELGQRRDLTVEQATDALQHVVVPLAERGGPSVYAEHLLSALAEAAVGVLLRAAPQEMRRPDQVALSLARLLSVVASFSVPARTARPHALLAGETEARLPGLVVATARESLRRHRTGAVGAAAGEALWGAVVALSVNPTSSPAPSGAPLADAVAVREVLAAWHLRGPAVVWEQSAALLRACVTSPPLTPPPGTAVAGESALALEVLTACVTALQGAPQLPVGLTSGLLAALVGGGGGRPLPAAVSALLDPLGRRLVLSWEASAAAPTADGGALLVEVGRLLTGCPLSSSAHSPLAPAVADALLDLYVRLLQSLRPPPVLLPAAYASVLVRALERRAAVGDGGEALERAFQTLCTRRLGQRESLLRSTPLPPTALVAMVELADRLNATALAETTSATPATAAAQSLRSGTTTAILAELLELVLPCAGTDGASGAGGAVARCEDLATLNEVAALLSLPACAEMGLRQALATAVMARAVWLLRRAAAPPRDRAMLIACLVRAGVEPSAELLQAIRQ